MIKDRDVIKGRAANRVKTGCALRFFLTLSG
jgi:hypothetical protein